jgi:hypothetical protein
VRFLGFIVGWFPDAPLQSCIAAFYPVEEPEVMIPCAHEPGDRHMDRASNRTDEPERSGQNFRQLLRLHTSSGQSAVNEPVAQRPQQVNLAPRKGKYAHGVHA